VLWAALLGSQVLGRCQVKAIKYSEGLQQEDNDRTPVVDQVENDEALWLVGGITSRCLAVWDTERM
jgi:hypothetical protein